MNNEKCEICLKPMGNSSHTTNGIPVHVKCDGLNMLKTVKNDHIEKLEKSHLEYIKSGWMVTGQEFRPNTNTIIAKINEIVEKINTL